MAALGSIGSAPILVTLKVFLALATGSLGVLFEALDNHIMMATYTVKGDSFVADKPRAWSEKQIGGVVGSNNVDLAPDGKRIIALMPVETSEAQKAQSHVIFLMNFFDEVRRRTATQTR